MQRCNAKSKCSGVQCKNFAIKEWALCPMDGPVVALKQEKECSLAKEDLIEMACIATRDGKSSKNVASS
jgi:hypothetical protein